MTNSSGVENTSEEQANTTRHRRSATLPSIAIRPYTSAPSIFGKEPHRCLNPYLPENRAERQSKARSNNRRLRVSATDSRYRTDFLEIELIGTGSFSEVFKCRHTMDGNLYAIKRLNRQGQQRMSQLSSKKLHEASLQEVYALAALSQHPNLVSYLDAWMEDGDLYIQLEHCGSSLAQRICVENRVSEAELSSIGLQLSLALSHLHMREVVHRDVKPENAFESQRGIYKLGDLGFATLMRSSCPERLHGVSSMQLESTNDMEGDNRYLSKEVLQAPTACDLTKVDMFALGASLLELATATHLPQSGEPWQQLRTHGLDAISRTHSIDSVRPHLSQMICNLIDIEPTRRPSAQELCGMISQATSRQQQQIEADEKRSLLQRMKDYREIERLQDAEVEQYQAYMRSCADNVDGDVMLDLWAKAKEQQL